jgi:hypothetical protein
MRQEFNSISTIVYDLSDYLTIQMLGMSPDLDQLRHKADERLKDLARVIRKVRQFGLPKPSAQVNPDVWRYDLDEVLRELEEACRTHVTETARLAAEIPAFRQGQSGEESRLWHDRSQKATQSRLRTKATIDTVRQRLWNLSQKIDWRATQQRVAAPAAEARSASSQEQAAPARLTEEPPSMSDTVVNPEELLRARLRQAEEERRLAEEGKRLQEERLRPYRELRPRWERAWDAAYLWPGEQRLRGSRPDPQGFREWAGLWVELGEVLKAFDRIGREREQGLREMAGPASERGPQPPSMRPLARLTRAAGSGVQALDAAAAVLLLSCEGEGGRVASELENLHRDPDLQRFVYWLPFIRDALWHPEPDEDGLTRTAEPPEGVSFADFRRAGAAFGWSGISFAPREGGEAAPSHVEPTTPASLLGRIEAIRARMLEDARRAGSNARAVSEETVARRCGVQEGATADTVRRAVSVAVLRGDLEGEYLLPCLDPLWMEAAGLGLGPPPAFRGEPQTGPAAIEALEELARWVRTAMEPSNPASGSPPPGGACLDPEPAPDWPLVGEQAGRRDPLPELGRDPNRERQARYCQGFDPDWFMPALLAAKWRSYLYPREATRESVEQWVKRIDQMRVEYLGPFAMPGRAAELEAERENDLALIREHAPHLLETETACPLTPTDSPPRQAVEVRTPAPPSSPIQYLLNWREILDALDQKNNSENQRRVRQLNERYDGPIIAGGKGSQPRVSKDKLLHWWNGLEERFMESEQKQADTEATLQARHQYGRDGTVLPDISGHVQNRRGKKSDR